MIACPQCQHANPEGATHCEACFQILPTLIPCPHCGVAVQSDAVFCGQCGNAIATQPSPTEPNSEGSTAAVSAQNPPSSANLASKGIISPQLLPKKAYLIHERTQTSLQLEAAHSPIHLGKPNSRVPPDLDLSGFPSAEIVSRVHADIWVEGDQYWLEDTGSANGTYVNHQLLTPGNRQILRSGDRIALGKGDLVTFCFQFDE